MADEKETTKEDEAPASGPEGVPAIVYWRWDDVDRELFARVREMSRLKSTAEVLRFALGAAERELKRSGGAP